MSDDILILSFDLNVDLLKVTKLSEDGFIPMDFNLFFNKYLNNDKFKINRVDYSAILLKLKLLKTHNGEKVIYRTSDVETNIVFSCVYEDSSIKTFNVTKVNSSDLNAHLFDSLTKTYIRDLYESSIKRCLKYEDNTNSYLLMIDFDNFKMVNDIKGHYIGDVCLTCVVDKLKEIFHGHLIGRYGGDEFIIFLKDVAKYEFDELIKKALNITYFLKRINKNDVVTISIGVCKVNNRKEYDVLFKEADEALYKAKEYKNCAKVFNGETYYGERTIKKLKKTEKKKTTSRLLLKEEVRKRSIIFISSLVVAVIILASLLSVVDVSFNYNTNKQANTSAYSLMKKEVDTVKLISDKTIDDSFSKLKNVSKATSQIEGDDEEDTLNQYFTIMKQNCLVDNPGIILNNGTLCYEGGRYNITSYTSTISSLIRDKIEIIDRITMNNIDSILVGEPYNKTITYSDGSTLSIGAVVSLYSVTSFVNNLFGSLDSYNYVSLIESYGEKVVESENSDIKVFNGYSNILNAFKDDDKSKNTITNALLSEEYSLQLVKINGVNYFVYIDSATTKYNSWRVLMLTKYSDIYSKFGGIINLSVLVVNLLAAILLIVLVIASIIIYKLYSNEFKERYMDQTIRLINKERFFIDSETILNRSGLNHYLVYVNIKNFKNVNNEFNSSEADKYLAKLASIFEGYLSKNELLSREYSDRFIFLLNESMDVSIKNRMITMINNVQNDDNLKLESLIISFNVGIYSFDIEDRTEIWQALDRAKKACYETCETFGNNNSICLYDEEMLKEDELINFIEDNQDGALINHKFDVYYQGKYDLKNNCFAGCEALVRWKDPVRGFINTQKMVDVFEANGFINKLDLYVYETVLRDLRFRIDSGLKVVPVSVNLSRRHFEDSNFLDAYKHLMKTYKIDPSLIEFEITESIVLGDEIDLSTFIKEIHDMGCKVDIDDFGSGYSNLAMISQVDFDVIKLDRKLLFGKNKEFDISTKRILQSVIYLNKNNGKIIVCEGVDTKEQVDFLTQMGADFIQGFYFCKPLSKTEFSEILDNDNNK